MDQPEDPRPSADLLESTHPFPGSYQIKAIGVAADDFIGRVVRAVAEEMISESELEHSSRHTKDGRHVSLTLDLTVQDAEQVRRIYARIRDVEGLTLLF